MTYHIFNSLPGIFGVKRIVNVKEIDGQTDRWVGGWVDGWVDLMSS